MVCFKLWESSAAKKNVITRRFLAPDADPSWSEAINTTLNITTFLTLYIVLQPSSSWCHHAPSSDSPPNVSL